MRSVGVISRFVVKHGNTLPSEPIPRHMATLGGDPKIRSSMDGAKSLIEALSLKVRLHHPKKRPARSLVKFTPLGNSLQKLCAYASSLHGLRDMQVVEQTIPLLINIRVNTSKPDDLALIFGNEDMLVQWW